MSWNTTGIEQFAREASPFATALPHTLESEFAVSPDDGVLAGETMFEMERPFAAAETEEESSEALPGFAVEEVLRPVADDAAGEEEHESLASPAYEEEQPFLAAESDMSEAYADVASENFSAFDEAEQAYELGSSMATAEPEAELPYAELEDETATDLRQRIADVARAELQVWEGGKRHEAEPGMRPVLKAYWQTILSPAKADQFIDKAYAWSATFISTCMKRAGAGSAFEQDTFHAGYVANAKVARQKNDSSKFWAFSVTEAKPELGDVVVRDRPPTVNGPCAGTTFERVTSQRTNTTHGDIVVAVRPDSIDVVGGNVRGAYRKSSDTVAQKTIKLDANGYVAQPGGCRYFALVKPPALAVASQPITPSLPAAATPSGNATGGSGFGGVIGTIAGLPAKVSGAVQAGIITAQAGAAIARGERDEGKLTNSVFYAQHPELPVGYRIRPEDKALAQDWVRIRDQVIRPLLRALGSGPSSTPTAATTTSAAPAGVNAATVSRIEVHRVEIDRAAAAQGVSANLLRGIIAAESGGRERTGEGGSGYKGLMQSGRDPSHLTPSVSLREGAKKYAAFTQSMRRFFTGDLKQNFDALPEDTRIRIVMAGYNAGPVTVQRAMRHARAGGDVNRWMEPDHYLRALVSTGAYNPVQSVLEWGVRQGQLSADDMAADLARLSGTPLATLQRVHQSGGKWNVKTLATALRPLLFREKDQLKNDGSTTWASLQARASKSLLCAARFKQSHTRGYLDTIVRYKRYFDGRPG
ncbi:MAG TPA: DUF2272 domain-containing protein [Gemmatimonadaceae bacterium]|nr:DUF2272 domain-containing protein [Gemmatimonadaceae bacterium]